MGTNIKDIKKELNMAAANLQLENSEKGCCKITMGGSETQKSGITRSKCNAIAAKFPGASCSFSPGVSCSEL